ncbi:MAG: hypothetical protein ACR2NI_09080, partial [Pirellulales bacterium]
MPVKDVKIYTGAAEGWVSIGDLANLPISSTDGTVKLDSPSANVFAIETDSTRRVIVDTAKTTLKTGHYADFEDANGTICGRVQGSADRMLVGSLSDAQLWLTSNSVQYGVIDPDESAKGLQIPRGASGPFIKSNNDGGVNIALGDQATISGPTYSPLRLASGTTSCAVRFNYDSAPYTYFAGTAGSTFYIAGGPSGSNQLVIETDDHVRVPTELHVDKITSKVGAADDGYVDLGTGLGLIADDHAILISGGQSNTDEHTALVVNACDLKSRRGFHFLTSPATGRANGSGIIDVRSTDTGTITPGEETAEFHVRLDGQKSLDITSDTATISTGGGIAFSLDQNKYGRFTNHVGIASPAYSN